MTNQPAIRGVIFDLDGVLVTTDELHYQAWKLLADELKIPFDRQINHRLRGVSRIASLDIILERATRSFTAEEKHELAERKNAAFRRMLRTLGPGDVLPGVRELLAELGRRGVKMAVASSSKNAALILDQVGLAHTFDAMVDGNDVGRSKPDPELFLLAARRLGLSPAECVVVEDAMAGVEAGRRAGMTVLGIGTPETLPGVAPLAPGLATVTADQLVHAGPTTA